MGNGSVIEEMLKAMSQPVEAYVFLLQPQPRANAIVAQIVVKGSLFVRQPVQVHSQGLVLASPDSGMRVKRFPVHQERFHMAEVGAQLIQDAKAMRIDIAPVMD